MQVIGYRSGIKLGKPLRPQHRRWASTASGMEIRRPRTGGAHPKQGTGYDKPLSNVEMR